MADMNVGATGFDSLRAPGVVFEGRSPETPPTFRTGVPLFIGFGVCRRGGAAIASDESAEGAAARARRAVRLTRWEQLESRITVFDDSFLADAVQGFFQNGGESCYVLPIDAARPDALRRLFESLPFREWSPDKWELEEFAAADLICVPDIMLFRDDPDDVVALQKDVLGYCARRGNCFAILDAFPGESPQGELPVAPREAPPRGEPAADRRVPEPALDVRAGVVKHWRNLVHKDGALYFPWIRVEPRERFSEIADEPPSRTGEPDRRQQVPVRRLSKLVPPCGHIAGIYARSDARIGVHKAPANEFVRGVLDLDTEVASSEHARLNDVGVNCLRSFPGRGIRLWGARTLSGAPEWRYVHVRRLFITLTRWAEHNLSDLAFEPNDPALWESVRSRLGSYCYGLLRQRALKGSKPEEGYFVKCDAETNPPEIRDTGRVVAEVGLAPTQPAEFIVVRIARSAVETTATYLPVGRAS